MAKQRLIQINDELKEELLWALEQVEESLSESLTTSSILQDGAPPDEELECSDRRDEDDLDWLEVIFERLKTGIALTERELRTCVSMIKNDDVYTGFYFGPDWLKKKALEKQTRARRVVTLCEAAWENARRRELMAKERQQSPLTEAS